jgi:hypothetical protein
MIQEDLERRILYGLCCEWKTKTLQLRPSESKGFVQPLFAIRDFKRRWGSWSSEKREISLSAELVYHHSWGAVREVLFHEMAHQYAEQVLHGGNEAPHGPTFRRACHMLRANPKASTGHLLLDQRLSDDVADKEDRVLSLVRKLMALGRSENSFEAQAAMAKAHELLRNHQPDVGIGQETGDFISTLVGQPALRHSQEHYALSNLLQDFYFVCGVWVPAYALDRARMGTVLEITGRMHNVRTASYVHDFVMRFIEGRWKEYTGAAPLNRHRKSDFSMGIIQGFRKKISDGATSGQNPGRGLSLVALKDRELENQVAYQYPHLRKIRGRAVRRDEKVIRDGIAVGRNLILHRGIEEPANREIRRLPRPSQPYTT